MAVTVPTVLAAALDFLNSLPLGARAALHADALLSAAAKVLPFFSIGMGWVVPACLGLAVGLVWHFTAKKHA